MGQVDALFVISDFELVHACNFRSKFAILMMVTFLLSYGASGCSFRDQHPWISTCMQFQAEIRIFYSGDIFIVLWVSCMFYSDQHPWISTCMQFQVEIRIFYSGDIFIVLWVSCMFYRDQLRNWSTKVRYISKKVFLNIDPPPYILNMHLNMNFFFIRQIFWHDPSELFLVPAESTRRDLSIGAKIIALRPWEPIKISVTDGRTDGQTDRQTDRHWYCNTSIFQKKRRGSR